MSDVTRFSIYGEFATCKDHIARDKAEQANTVAGDASKLASSAQQLAISAQRTAQAANETASSANNLAGEANKNANESKINAQNAIGLATSANSRSTTAETTANEAKTTADDAKTIANNVNSIAVSANSKATDAQEKVNSLETEYNAFKERNSYFVSRELRETGITINAKGTHSIPLKIVHTSEIPENQKILLCVSISVSGGNVVSSGIAHSFYLTAQINGSTSKRMRDGYYCPPSNYLDASTCFAITDIAMISQILLGIYSYEGVENANINTTVNIIPISGEEYVSE